MIDESVGRLEPAAAHVGALAWVLTLLVSAGRYQLGVRPTFAPSLVHRVRCAYTCFAPPTSLGFAYTLPCHPLYF